jgi:TolB-like protein/Tfp pilus assembly protein PilF
LSVERSALNVERSAPKGAVFLSYARDDAAAARRVAEALRSAGLEVWFDENELRGGDAWDAKIRKQINDCTLFLPVISQHTQERNKGYFRLEWKLAVEQTHLMAEGVPFLAPVVIDDTREAGAVVPPEFMRVQWTRLPGALPTPQFVGQVQRLLAAPGTDVGRGLPTPPPSRAHPIPAGSGDPALQPKRSSANWFSIVLVVAVLALVAYIALRPTAKEIPVSAAPAKPNAEAKLVAKVSDKSLAVLPFANMSEDKDASAFFADGMHEDLLTNLAFVRDLHVVSRTSVMQYRNTLKPISQIAQELKVAYVLEGSVRRAGNKVRVTGQLIRAATDEHVWANNYDRDLSDVFAIQAELSKSIAGALQAVLSPETKALLERRPTDNPAAYDAYLRARQLNNSGAFLAVRDLVVLLRRAVELDPKFAAAWADLARNEAFVFFKTVQTPAQLALAKAAIDQAVQLAPEDPAVIEGLGNYYYYGYRDYARATEQFLRLAQLRPNDAAVYASLAYVQRRQGRMSDALPNFRRAADLDPQSPLHETDVIYCLIGCRQYAEAEARSRKFLQLHPGHLDGAMSLGQAEFAARGSTDAMRALAALSVPLSDRAEHLYVQLQNARAAANWAEAIRLDREQRYFDGDDDNPRFLQDVLAAATSTEAGDSAACRTRATEALATMNTLLAQQPLNARLWAALSLAHGLLGAHDDAVRCGAKARELLPESKDAMSGAALSALCASALAYAGEKDRALAEFERLLHVPFGTNPILDRGISVGSWKPLRADPRFEALINDPKNNQPLF